MEELNEFTQMLVDTCNLLKTTITITKEEYSWLKERDMKLRSLERAGVDNWEGYDYNILEKLKENK